MQQQVLDTALHSLFGPRTHNPRSSSSSLITEVCQLEAMLWQPFTVFSRLFMCLMLSIPHAYTLCIPTWHQWYMYISAVEIPSHHNRGIFMCSQEHKCREREIFDTLVIPLRILLYIAVLCGVYQYAAVPNNTWQNLKVAVTLLRI